ncbi:MAG: hypothetical protein LJE95_02025 [Acidobacteria bacterium]|nr:hypothetical protein [Acidobacteriota bacterium]
MNKTMTTASLVLAMLVATLGTADGGTPAEKGKAVPSPERSVIELPGGGGRIGFDDVGYSKTLKRILLPGGRTGKLDLIDPASGAVTAITGFSTAPASSRHGGGITSVDQGGGFLFVSDRTARTVDVVDAATRKIVTHASLAGGPDYVRFVGPTRELWVTEPHEARIEVLGLPPGKAPVPFHQTFITVPGGPESLVVDASRGLAYTNLWRNQTLAIDLKKQSIVSRWINGCAASRGLALDRGSNLLFVGCAEGGATVLDLAHGGKVVDTAKAGEGVDIIDFSPVLRHLYVPGGRSGTLSILGVSPAGKLTLLGEVAAAKGVHGVAAADGKAFVPDPENGRLLVFTDPYPRTR